MLKSFIDIPETSHFPIQNLPYCVFSSPENENRRVGARIGDYILDLHLLDEFGFFSYYLGAKSVFDNDSLNPFMALGKGAWQEARAVMQNILRAENPTLKDPDFQSLVLHPIENIKLFMPVQIGDYTDFYASLEHASNVGTMFRGKENALMPNWRHLPVGYHGRASSIILSGTDIHRPSGQILPVDSTLPIHTKTAELDFELEMGFFIGPGSNLGERVTMDKAADHIFGMVLLNDWSARDIQRWEYRPLGPFLAKNFATSISPWVVTMEALEPFRAKGPAQNPDPLPYLQSDTASAFDIQLEVLLKTRSMNQPTTVSRSNFKHLYWSIFQQLVHHTSTGCNLKPGDLMGTGTISGPTKDSSGSMLELSWRGQNPLKLENGESRSFLEDEDMVILTGYCQGQGFRVGFGEVAAKILPAL